MTLMASTSKGNFKILDDDQLKAVSGGNHHINGAGVDPVTLTGSPFSHEDIMAIFGSYGDGVFLTGWNGILVEGSWGTIDLQGDSEIRIYSDRSQALFVQGLYVGDIKLTGGSATLDDADLSAGVQGGQQGVGVNVSVTTEGGTVLNYTFVPAPQH